MNQRKWNGWINGTGDGWGRRSIGDKVWLGVFLALLVLFMGMPLWILLGKFMNAFGG
jgi:hypothetical protein